MKDIPRKETAFVQIGASLNVDYYTHAVRMEKLLTNDEALGLYGSIVAAMHPNRVLRLGRYGNQTKITHAGFSAVDGRVILHIDALYSPKASRMLESWYFSTNETNKTLTPTTHTITPLEELK